MTETPEVAPERDPLAHMSPSTMQRQAARTVATMIDVSPAPIYVDEHYEDDEFAVYIAPWLWRCLLGEGTDEDCAALQRALGD